MNNSIIKSIGSKLTTGGSMTLLKIKKYSPEILTGVGIIGVIGGTIVACKATLKAEEILDIHHSKMNSIKDALDICEEYTEKDATQDTIVSYIQTSRDFVKLYLPAALLIGGGIVCFLSAHGIMKKRNVAITAAYTLINEAFTKYRGRVVEELGKDKDFHFRYGTTYEQITEEITDENGKKKKIKKEIQVLKNNGENMYSRYFAEQVFDVEGRTYTGSSQWCKQPLYNVDLLVIKNQWANEYLKAHGYVFLNDIYEELGFQRTKAGQIVGWLRNGDGDNYISFGPEVDAFINKTASRLEYTGSQPILLDFNVDGPILDLI